MFAMAVWGLSWTNAKILGIYTSPLDGLEILPRNHLFCPSYEMDRPFFQNTTKRLQICFYEWMSYDSL